MIRGFTQNRSNYTSSIILVIICLIFLLADSNNYLAFLHHFVELNVNPAKKAISGQYKKISGNKNPYLADSDFINKLEAEQKAIKILNKKITELKNENQDLHRQLNSPLPADLSLLPAEVLGINRHLSIDKGAKNGIKLNQPVIFQDVLIGKIVKVSAKSAMVLLPVDPESKIAAIDQITGAAGIVTGQFHTSLVFEKVLVKEKITKDDLIITSGQEKIFPKNLIIAEVTKVNKSETDVFQTAEIKPFLDYQKLSRVFVILD